MTASPLEAELAEVIAVAKGCAKREAQYFADRKDLLVALKRARIALNLVPANDKRFDPANYKQIKQVTDIIDEALAAIAAATGTAKTPQAVECEASQSGGAAASPKGNRR